MLVAGRELGRDLRAKEGVSDLVQRTFLEAHRDFERFQGRTEGELRAWLRGILRNDLGHVVDRYRGTGKREIGREVRIDDTANLGVKESMAEETVSVSAQVIRREQEEAVRRALTRLPEHQSRIFHWRYRDGASFEQIGRRLGCSADGARKAWGRVIGRLQRELSGGVEG
jgi:RNA polymerase sigma-70 factor (ECF subfamily)